MDDDLRERASEVMLSITGFSPNVAAVYSMDGTELLDIFVAGAQWQAERRG